MRIGTALLFVALLPPCSAQDWEAQVQALRPADTSSQQAAVLDDLEQRARKALDRIPRATTQAEADKARGPLRRRLEESLGFRRLPWPPDLRAAVTGVVPGEGYRIEKVVFQTLPGTWAPAHLYLPDKPEAPAPAVLFYNGHWWPDSKSRPDFQTFCINMARMGFVVFSFDPFGQGERGVSSRDHRRTETLLAGISQQGIAEYETRCALEYLLSRHEVDRQRVGMTGASGGGYNTWITAALDDRISVVVPVVGTSDFYEQIHVTRPLDWYHAAEHCHYVPGLIQYANNHELLAMVAPKPLLIVAASVDQSFPIAGVRAVHEYGQQLYRAFGGGGKIGFFEDREEGHGYQKAKRQAAYGWFLRWLMNRGDGQPVPEPDTVTLPFDSPQLQCFSEGRKEPAGPGIVEMVKRMAKDLPPSANPAPLEKVMGEMPRPVPMSFGLRPTLKPQRVIFETEAGIHVPTFVIRPGPQAGSPENGTLVAVDDRGKEALVSDPLILEAMNRHWTIWAIDPRGIGELAIPKSGWAFAVSLLLGENFVWRQGWDIRRIVEFVAQGSITHRVALSARGHNAALAAAYAVGTTQSAAPEWAVLRGGFVSFRQFFERPRSLEASFRLQRDDVREQRKTAFDQEIPHDYFAFGMLQAADLPQLLGGAKARTFIIDPINGDWEAMGLQQARTMLPDRVRLTTVEEFVRGDW
jgi:dienelactone hydrolase